MILHGNARGGGRDLASHLLRDDENDHVHVHEVRGFMAEDVRGAFLEVQAMASSTKAEKYLFSLSLSPPKGGNVSAEEFEKAISKAEDALGLTGQPRVIVFHEKGDNRDRHAHAVWSRIDGAEGKAIALPFNRMRMREVSRALFIQHGWDVPHGLINRQECNPLNYTFDQYQHAKRLGKDARGDRRGFVAIDTGGEPYSIPKWLGLKIKIVRDRLGKEQDLPSVAETKASIGRDMSAKLKDHQTEHNARNAFHKKQRRARSTRPQRRGPTPER